MTPIQFEKLLKIRQKQKDDKEYKRILDELKKSDKNKKISLV